MEQFFIDYLKLLKRLHDEAILAIQDLPREALEWVPAPEMNSFNVLFTHLAGAERYWIGDVAGGYPSGRIRDEEFETQGQGIEELVEHLQSSYAHAEKTLRQLTIQDLDQKKSTSLQDQVVTIGWALAHALEHSALHVGHIQIQRQWWKREQEK